MYLETSYAPAIISQLEDAQDIGLSWVVLEPRPMELELQPHQISFFDTMGEALDYWETVADQRYLPGDNEFPIYYKQVDQLLDEIKQANHLNEKTMNRNNLETLKEEMKALGFNAQPRIKVWLAPPCILNSPASPNIII
jgi:hypothetical protein